MDRHSTTSHTKFGISGKCHSDLGTRLVAEGVARETKRIHYTPWKAYNHQFLEPRPPTHGKGAYKSHEDRWVCLSGQCFKEVEENLHKAASWF